MSSETGIRQSMVEIDPSVEGLPFRVVVDEERLEALVLETNINPKEIENVSIQFFGGYPKDERSFLKSGTLGDYNRKTQKIRVFLENGWNNYRRHLKKAVQITDGTRKPHPGTFSELLTTSRLADYLATIPREKDFIKLQGGFLTPRAFSVVLTLGIF